MVRSWPTVNWILSAGSLHLPRLTHAGTSVYDGVDDAGCRSGDTVWCGTIGSERVGLAWHWVEVRVGVLALSDPNTISSNLNLLVKAGEAADDYAAITALNTMVYALNWQELVSRVLRGASPGRAGQGERD